MKIKLSKDVWYIFPLLLLSSCNGADVSFMGFVEKRIDLVKEKQQFGKKATDEGKYDGKFPAGGSISGRLTGSQNIPLANSLISFQKENSTEWLSINANQNGEFRLTNLEPGIYNFIFLAAGYQQTMLTGIEINSIRNSGNENLKIILKQ